MELLREIIKEQNFELSFEDLIKEIKSNALYDSNMPIFRGMYPENKFGKKYIRKDRKPRDTTESDTEFFNKIFEKEYGISNIRFQTAFLTSSSGEAREYGIPHYIFPVKGSKFIYNKKVDDSVSLVRGLKYLQILSHELDIDLEKDNILEIVNKVKDYENNKATPVERIKIDNLLNSMDKISNYTVSEKLPDLKRIRSEIMLLGEYYYFIKTHTVEI